MNEKDLMIEAGLKRAKAWAGDYVYLDNSLEVEDFARDVQLNVLQSVLARINKMQEWRKELEMYDDRAEKGYKEILEDWIAGIKKMKTTQEWLDIHADSIVGENKTGRVILAQLIENVQRDAINSAAGKCYEIKTREVEDCNGEDMYLTCAWAVEELLEEIKPNE